MESDEVRKPIQSPGDRVTGGLFAIVDRVDDENLRAVFRSQIEAVELAERVTDEDSRSIRIR